MSKKILMIVGDFVEDYEVMVPFQALEMLGLTVHAICPGKKIGDFVKTAVHDFEGDQTYSEKRGHNFAINADFDNINTSDYEALVIPGGRAPEYLRLNKKVLSIVKDFVSADSPIAAICHGIQILIAAGAVKNMVCTAHPALEPDVICAGGTFVKTAANKAYVNKNFVTAQAWPAHPEWLAKFIEMLGIKISF